MRKLVSVLSIFLLVGLVAACGTDDPAASANNSNESDVGVDADDNGPDATDGGGDATDGGGGGQDADTGGDDADGGDPPDGCSSDADCTAPDRCVAVSDTDDVRFECGTPNAGGGEAGDSCTADADCAQNLCLGGQCAEPCGSDDDCAVDGESCTVQRVDLGNGNTDTVQVCAAPTACASKDDCGIGEVCYVDRSGGSVETYCRAENSGGGGLGNICTADVGCAANLCHDGRFRQACTNPCDDDADCDEDGYECGTATIDDGAGGTVDLSACVASDPNPCNTNDDCGTGLACAIVPDEAQSSLESVCVPNAGGKSTGVECTDDADCASLVCLDGHCAAPCTTGDQCAAGQRCSANTITKDPLSGTFNVCETLPDERCDQTGTCSDGLRVCSEIRSLQNGDREAYCQFPDSSAPESLGGHCTQSSDCRERICLTGNSDECSVICAADNQCASGQICTTFNSGNSQLGFCSRGCGDNSDCAPLDFTNSGGQLIEHVCMVNENTRENGADQICLRKNIVDPNDSTAGLLGDACDTGSGSECQSGLCLRTVTFNGTTCTSDSQCQTGQVCQTPPGGGSSQCGDVDFKCSRVCDDNGDCSSGISGNELTACATDVTITFGSGATDTVSMCAKPN